MNSFFFWYAATLETNHEQESNEYTWSRLNQTKSTNKSNQLTTIIIKHWQMMMMIIWLFTNTKYQGESFVFFLEFVMLVMLVMHHSFNNDYDDDDDQWWGSRNNNNKIWPLSAIIIIRNNKKSLFLARKILHPKTKQKKSTYKSVWFAEREAKGHK